MKFRISFEKSKPKLITEIFLFEYLHSKKILRRFGVRNNSQFILGKQETFPYSILVKSIIKFQRQKNQLQTNSFNKTIPLIEITQLQMYKLLCATFVFAFLLQKSESRGLYRQHADHAGSLFCARDVSFRICAFCSLMI